MELKENELTQVLKRLINKLTTITMAMGWFLLFVAPSNAQSPLLGNQGFQIITEGNFTSNGSHHIHGALAVGGNLIISNGGIGEVNMDAVSGYVFPGDGSTSTGMLVGGSITWTSGEIRILNNKYVHVGNSTGSLSGDNGTNSATQVYPVGTSYNNAKKISTTIDQTPSPAVFQASPLNFTTMFETFNNNSFGLSNCTANVQLYNNSNVAISGNNVTAATAVKITSLIDGINHLKLTSTSLTNITELKFEGTGIPSATKILVISVNLTANYTWNNCNMPGISGTQGAYILWNFYGSTTYNLTLNTASLLIGTVFAPSMNFIKTGTGDIDGNIVAKTANLGTGEVHYYPFNSSVPNCCVNVTVPGVIAGDQSGACGYDPAATTSTSSASGGSGTLEYGWEYSIDGGTTWINISGATSTTYNPTAIYVTTKYRRKARRRGCDTWTYSNVITKTVTSSATAIAGADQSQCYNSAFSLSGNQPASSSYEWSVVSGTAESQDWYSADITVSVPSGTSATLRYTVTTGSCIATDDVVLSNTVDCTPVCDNMINLNGDLEQEGTATNFNLSFQSTPALLIQKNITPTSWFERYGGSVTSTTAFNGAFYLKKTGTAGDPHSGTHMVYMKGSGICLSSLATNAYLHCGKTYKFSVWVAAYTNSTTQTASPFALEHSSSDGTNTYAPTIQLMAPASASWNDLNWQRYDFIFTVPGNGYQWGDFYFTSGDATTGIVIDDVCISEIYAGSSALAGLDQYGCSNVFRMEATTPAAGYTGTWSVASGTASITSPNSPTSQVTITSGTTAYLTWTVTNSSGCTSSDQVAIGYTTGTGMSVNSASICSGESATLTATGCTSSLLWSTGATTSSITVSPTTTTTYRVTCTPPQTTNLILNGNFEATTNFQNWSNWGNTAITTTAGEVRTGSKAAKVNATAGWGGFGQEIAVTPNQFFTISFWARAVNMSNPEVGVTFFNSAWTEITTSTTVDITSTTYTKYTFTIMAPPTAAWLQLFFQSDQEGILLIDDIEVVRATSCQTIASPTVTVSTATLAMAAPTVSSCIDHPIQDVATVSTAVSWSNAPSGDKIRVTLNNKTEIIDVAGGATSPTTVTFMVPANSATNQTITATWLNTAGCSASRTFNAPAPCTSNPLNCDILYLCGLDKPADGDAWDHGFINYLDEVNTGNVTPILVKPDASGMGTYNPNSPNTAVTVDLSLYKTIIMSPTTQGSLSTDMMSALKGFTGGVLNMNYDAIDDLGQITGSGVAYWTSGAYTDNTTFMEVYNYDNIAPIYNLVMTGGAFKSGAAVTLWANAGDASAGTNGIRFSYPAHTLAGISTTHGKRVYLGFHMNGLYANAANGGAIPAPASSYFHPTKHFTLNGKIQLERAILEAVGTCMDEVCDNGIDDDGDGREDCIDPDCGLITNREFDNGTTGWQLYVQASNAATLTQDKTNQLSGVNAAKVNVTTTQNGTDWHVQLAQAGKTLVAGTKYTITFTAKASTARAASFALQQGVSPFTSYYFQNINLTTTATSFSFDYTPTATYSNVTLLFNLAKATGNIWIDNVQVKNRCEVCTNGIDDDGDGLGDALDDDCPCDQIVTTTPSGHTAQFLGVTYSNEGGICRSTWTYKVKDGLSGGDLTQAGFGNLVCQSCMDGSEDFVYAEGGTAQYGSDAVTGYCGLRYTEGFTANQEKIYVFQLAGSYKLGKITFVAKSATSLETAIICGPVCSAPVCDNYSICQSNTWSPASCSCTNAIAGDGMICVGESTTLTASGGGTYLWSTGATTASITVNPTITTTYIVTVTASGGCVSTARATVTVNTNPTASISGGTSVCLGSSVTMTASGGVSYLWSTGATTAAITVAPTVNTTYTVTVTNITGCTATSNRTITVNALPTPTVTGTNTICSGQSTTLTAAGGTSYLWSTAATTAAITVSPTTTTTYTVTVTAANGCTATGTRTVTVNPKPTVSYTGSSVICIGDNTTLSPSTGGTWTSSNTAVATVSNAGVVTAVAAGTANFTYTATATGCASNPTGNATVEVKPVVTITGDNSLCIGGTTTVTPATGGTWISNNPSVATITNAGVVTALAAGTSTFRFTQTSNNCNSLPTASITVVTDPTPAVSGGDVTICTGGTVALTSSVTGGLGTTTYQWQSSANGSIWSNISGATASTYTTSSLISSTYYRVSITQTGQGCTATASNSSLITVVADPGISVTGGGVSVCNGATATLGSVITGGTGTPSYQWQSSINNSTWTNITGATAANYTTPAMTAARYYRVALTMSGVGCGAVNSTGAQVTVNPIPAIAIQGETTICFGGSTTLTAVGSNGTPAYSFSWNSGLGSGDTKTLAPSVNTAYQITVTDGGGCTSSSIVNVTVEDCCTPPPVDAICTPPATFNVNVVATGIKTFQSLTGVSPSNITNKIKITGTGTVVVNHEDLVLKSATAVLQIDGPTLIVLGAIKVETAGARFIQTSGTLRTVRDVRQYANTGICISNTSVEIGEEKAGTEFYSQADCSAASFINDGGYRYLSAVCMNVTQDFQLLSTGTGTGTNGVDLIKNACIEVGDKGNSNATTHAMNAKDAEDGGQWQSSSTQNVYGTTIVLANGNFQNLARTMTLCDVKVKINDSGSFTNASIMEGFQLCVAVDDVLENTGIWSLPEVNWYSKSLNTTNVPGVGLELTESAILSQCFVSCSCSFNNCDNFVGDLNGDDVICIGESTGLVASGGTNYLWENGSTTTNIVITPVISAWHGVYIEDNNKCFKYDSIYVIVNPLPTAFAGTDKEVCLGSAATLTAIATGGSTPYTYLWENGTTTASRSVSPAVNTTYTVSVTDANGCSNADQIAVAVNALPVADAGLNKENCVGTSTTIAATASGGTAPYSYLWSTSSSLPTISVSPAVTTAYTITVTDSKGCTRTDDMVVTVNALPDANAGADNQICIGQSATISASASGGVGPYTYHWSNGQTTASTVVSPAISTTYTLTVTDAKGCTKTDQVLITVNPLPIANAGVDTMLCTGNSVGLLGQASGGLSPYSFLWSNGTPAAANTVMPTTTTKYYLTVTDANVCSHRDSVIVTVHPIPNAGPDPSPQNCYSIAQIIMSATGTGTWSLGSGSAGTADIGSATNPNTDVYNFSNLGYYYMVWTNSGGCRDTATLFVNDACTCPISDNLVDAPATVVYCGSTGALTINGYAAYPSSGVYQWEYSFNNGSFSNAPGTNTSEDYTTPNLGIGTHKFRRRFTTTSGVICSTLSNTIALVVRDVPSVSNPSIGAICAGKNATVTPNSGGTWTSSNPAVATITNSGVITGIAAGSATFTFTNSISGCVSSPTSAITVNDKPAITLTGDATICLGTQTSLIPSIGGTWTSSNPSIASISNAGTVTGVSPGSATFTFTATSTGCVSLVSAPVTVRSVPQVIIDFNGSICITDTSELSANVSAGTPPYSYQWVGPSMTANTKKIDISTNGNYTVTVSDQNLCTAVATGFVYERFDPVIVSLETSVCEGNSIVLNAVANGAADYLWSENAGSSTNSLVEVFPNPPSTTYHVQVTNTHGCSATATAVINVIPKPDIEITGSTSICIGAQSFLFPISGGTWVAGSPGVASVTNDGVILGLAGGASKFIYIDSITGCKSDSSAAVIIGNNPVILRTGPASICVGSTTSFSPSSGGVWTSSNPAVATINNNGIVTGVSQGTATFTFSVGGTNCISLPSDPITVHPLPEILLLGDDVLCMGENSLLSPNSGGSWTSSNATVASISPTGVVSTIGPGKASFVFTLAATSCKSLPSDSITIYAKPVIAIAGDSVLCVGESSALTTNEGGTWSSSSPGIASINSSGQITAIEQGQTTFTLTSSISGCVSNATRPFLVNPLPVVVLSGSDQICIGSTTQLYPISGGIWESSDSLIASVNNAGLVTGINIGEASFVFTDAVSGCMAALDTSIEIYDKPAIGINGPTTICAGDTSYLLPATGGYWQSTAPDIATVSNDGVIIGVDGGEARFIYTEGVSGCISDTSLLVNILARPDVAFDGPAEVCVGESTQLSPAFGGIWTSLNPDLAEVTIDGEVNAISQGLAKFVYQEIGGCESLPTDNLIIHAKPEITFAGTTVLCPGQTSLIVPTTGGTWTSTNPAVATIDNNGVITSVGFGVANFYYEEASSGCVSQLSGDMHVYNAPFVVLTGSSHICVGATTSVSPTIGGVWMSSNPTVATVNNAGVVTGISAGTVSLSFTNATTGCTSVTPITITVNPKPSAALSQSNMCAGDTILLNSPEPGNWISMSPATAKIILGDSVIGLNPGVAYFTFKSEATGCVSTYSSPLFVNPKPYAQVIGPQEICEGATTIMVPSVGGVWHSSDETIATVDSQGLVTAIKEGQAYFTFTELSTGCKSQSSETSIYVTQGITVQIQGSTDICLGYSTQLSSSSEGTWQTQNSKIAVVDNNGIVTGTGPGRVTFVFTEAGSGCKASLPSDVILVRNCIDPDFNVTLKNTTVTGNVATNDDAPVGTSYEVVYTTLSKPVGSTDELTIAPNGQYQFKANMPGKYVYQVPACIPPVSYNCPAAQLTITVLDISNSLQTAVANTDIASNGPDNPVNIKIAQNDNCVSGYPCNIDIATLEVLEGPYHGTYFINTDGSLSYTPDSGHVGLDTIVYEVCLLDDPGHCAVSELILVSNSNSAVNSTVAADDFFSVWQGETLSESLVMNDTDPEGDAQQITARGSVTSPIVISEGSYYIESDGTLHFTPASTFKGPVDIAYTICDENGFCTNATAHIMVLEPMSLRIRVYLEGAMIDNNNAFSQLGRPLMRDNLRKGPDTGWNVIPQKDPYKFATPYVDVTQYYQYTMPGILPQYDEITDSASVFSIEGDDAIVDWVFVQLRSKDDYRNVIATRSGLLQRDGDIVDLDGVSPLGFAGLTVDSFYVAVRHRSHLGVMSRLVARNQLVDFTSVNTPVFDFGTTLNNGYDYTNQATNNTTKNGYRTLWAGDFNGDGKLKFTNPSDDINVLYFDILFHEGNPNANANYNFGYGYYQGDVNMNGKIKFDNPNDDKNLLYAQILFYKLNAEFISNFNFFIQQIP